MSSSPNLIDRTCSPCSLQVYVRVYVVFVVFFMLSSASPCPLGEIIPTDNKALPEIISKQNHEYLGTATENPHLQCLRART